MARIEDIHRNTTIHGGLQRLRVQYFGSEMGQFGSFVEADGFDVLRVGANARIGGHHPVNIRPNLDGFGFEARTENRCGKVGAAPA